MPEMTTPDARQRIAAIQATLTERATTTISAGHAQLLPTDTLESLLTRAQVTLDAAKRSA